MHGFIYVSEKSPYTIGLIVRCFKRRAQRIRPMMETKWKMERRHYSGTSQTGNWALSLAPRLLIPPRLRSTVPYHRAPSLELRASHQLTSRCRVFSRSSPPSRLPRRSSSARLRWLPGLLEDVLLPPSLIQIRSHRFLLVGPVSGNVLCGEDHQRRQGQVCVSPS